MRVRVCVCPCLSACVRVCARVCACVRVCARVRVPGFVRACVPACVLGCAYVCARVRTYACVYGGVLWRQRGLCDIRSNALSRPLIHKRSRLSFIFSMLEPIAPQ